MFVVNFAAAPSVLLDEGQNIVLRKTAAGH